MNPAGLAMFVRFVRMNPHLAPDDPLIEAVLNAYLMHYAKDEAA